MCWASMVQDNSQCCMLLPAPGWGCFALRVALVGFDSSHMENTSFGSSIFSKECSSLLIREFYFAMNSNIDILVNTF